MKMICYLSCSLVMTCHSKFSWVMVLRLLVTSLQMSSKDAFQHVLQEHLHVVQEQTAPFSPKRCKACSALYSGCMQKGMMVCDCTYQPAASSISLQVSPLSGL